MKQVANALIVVFVSLPMLAQAVGVPKAMSKQALILELTGKETVRQSDVSLYSEIVGAYQADDELGLKSRLQNFMSRYSKSEYADNCLYLAGRMAIDHKNYAEALKLFSQIQKQYPHGDKVVAASFAKGMAYKKMRLPRLAEQVLSSVKKNYPGSPESFRADAEIKIMR